MIFSSVYTCISASQDDVIWTQSITVGYHEDGSRISVTFYDIAIDDSGVYIVGSDESPGKGSDQWRIEKRDLVDGSLIWVQQNPQGENHFPYNYFHGVAVDDSGVYILGFARVEKRRIELLNTSAETTSSQNTTRTITQTTKTESSVITESITQTTDNQSWLIPIIGAVILFILIVFTVNRVRKKKTLH